MENRHTALGQFRARRCFPVEVSFELRSRKQPEVNCMKSGEDYFRLIDRNIYSQGSYADLGGYIGDSGFLSMTNGTC